MMASFCYILYSSVYALILLGGVHHEAPFSFTWPLTCRSPGWFMIWLAGMGRNIRREASEHGHLSASNTSFFAYRRYVQQTETVPLEVYPYCEVNISNRLVIIASQSLQPHSCLINEINGSIVPEGCGWMRAYMCIDENYWVGANVILLRRLG